MKFALIISFFIFLSNFLHAQNPDSLIIQNKENLSICLSKASTEYFMKECYLVSTIELDSILNIIYKKTLPLLKTNDQVSFRDNQRKWLSFYNSEKGFNLKTFCSQNNDDKYQFGTLVDLAVRANNYDILKSRVETLSYYYTILTTGL